MKNTFVLCFLFVFAGPFSANAQVDPVILKINGENIPQSEFMYIYTKNNDTPSFDDDSLDAYMKLFVNYKLKVKEAHEKKYDTLPNLKSELTEYRSQLSLPYMIDQSLNENLIRQAYERTTTEVRASHILIRCPPNAAPKDTAFSYKRCLALRDKIVAGQDWVTVAQGNMGSEDPSVKQNGGDLGFFTAFQMVYDFEEAAFNMPVGEISMPVRTQFGYHLIKVTGKRPAFGQMTAAHIMIVTAEDMTDEEKKAAKDKIFEIYGYFKAGEKFEDLAAKYSDDKSSKAKGGLIPVFGPGAKQRMIPIFEEAVYKLQKDEEVTEPVQSPYGWHIIKRIHLEPLASFEQMHRELKLKVERDARAAKLKDAFINNLKKEYNFADPNAAELVAFVASQMDSTVYLGKWTGLQNTSKNAASLMRFADKNYTVGDFNGYLLSTQKKRPKKDSYEIFAKEAYDAFVNAEISKYEDAQLERKYPAFKSLIQEYSDGILVFEIMQKEIWDKASADTVGIRNYYEAHKSDFPFPVRYDGTLYRCRTKDIAKQVLTYLGNDTMTYDKIQTAVNGDHSLNCVVKDQVFNSETTDAFRIEKKGKVTYRTFIKGTNKTYLWNKEYCIMDVREILPPRLREFHEAKGLATAAYQTQKEKEWLEQLHKKYTIEIMTDVLHAIEGSGK